MVNFRVHQIFMYSVGYTLNGEIFAGLNFHVFQKYRRSFCEYLFIIQVRDHPFFQNFCKSTESMLGEGVNPVVCF